MLIVHTYYTSGMHELAKIFVESFSEFHTKKQLIPLIVEGVDLTTSQVEDLRKRCAHIRINQHHIDMEYWANECNVPKSTLMRWRHEIEHSYVTPVNRVWKLLVAGDHRVKTVRNIVQSLHDYPMYPPLRIPPDMYRMVVAHFDIDTIFRENIEGIADYVSNHDVALKLRPKIQPVKARITIDTMVIKNTGASVQWLNDWTKRIDAVPPRQRPIGFGQSSCWEAYVNSVEKHNLQAFKLPLEYGLPGRNKPSDVIWCGNLHKVTKDSCTDIFNKELLKIKRGNHD
jgi:hypothetical protein